jgi:predicted ATP-dependent endonuclease of OLD family
MILSKLSYIEFNETSRYWELEEFELGKINLIVGHNTSGKTRTLNVILGLSRILTVPQVSLISGLFDAFFTEKENTFHYIVGFKDGMISHEKLTRNNVELFSRDSEGLGIILNEDSNVKQNFKIPKNQLIATRRDEIQFPYLEELYKWASNTRHFRFSKEAEKHTLVLIDSNKPLTDANNQNMANQAIAVFRKGTTDFRNKFIDKVIRDFNSIGYSINKIDYGALQSLKVDSSIGNKVVGLRVYENDRKGMTDQNEMSDGMFRALSLIIHYNYYELTEKSLIVLIDDIGEGMDYERSTNLIKLLIDKSKKTDIQLIMSSNDRFVMNNTNLEYWQAISRVGGKVKMHNKFNSSESFKKFKFTGLNNFDFFTTEYYKSEKA